LDAIKKYHDNGVWIEITTLLVPGHNDSKMMLDEIADFIVSIDSSIPWHISRFHPSYNMRDTQSTRISTIHKAVEIGKQHGIKHIYSGNVPGDDYESTFCSHCGERVISRAGFFTVQNHLVDGTCPSCGKKPAGLIDPK
jgi:pyruvate formate lyase activating enzyme